MAEVIDPHGSVEKELQRKRSLKLGIFPEVFRIASLTSAIKAISRRARIIASVSVLALKIRFTRAIKFGGKL